MKKNTVNILGTEYTIETHKISEDETLLKNRLSGYCDHESKLLVIADMTEKEYVDLDEKGQETYRKKTLRHECIHAFFGESGLQASSNGIECGWSENEEMVDWFAIQSPKIFKVFTELDIL